MSDTITTNQTAGQQPETTPTPEGSGGQGGEKMFSQEEVNRIVGERLARAKRETSTDEREAALRAKEARLDCREYLSDKKYPVELLDILDTADVESFKSSVERLAELFQNMEYTGPTITVDLGASLTSSPSRSTSAISDAFKPPKI